MHTNVQYTHTHALKWARLTPKSLAGTYSRWAANSSIFYTSFPLSTKNSGNVNKVTSRPMLPKTPTHLLLWCLCQIHHFQLLKINHSFEIHGNSIPNPHSSLLVCVKTRTQVVLSTRCSWGFQGIQSNMLRQIFLHMECHCSQSNENADANSRSSVITLKKHIWKVIKE